jgi:hypothetical protein
VIEQRPVFGIGPGNYVLWQHSLTGLGRPAKEVAADGALIYDQAHNDYLQIAAEMGVPGLLLHLLLVGTFLWSAWSALGQLPVGARRTLLIGSVSGIVAQSVDAMSNPAWRFSFGCGLAFWAVLGLGSALVRLSGPQPESGETGARRRRRSRRRRREAMA